MRLLVLAALLLGGCPGGGDPGGADGGVLADGDPGADAGPGPTASPALPTLTPCATGWREAPDPSGVSTCEPWPESGVADCPRGEAHFPGEAACTPVGSPCPAGDFPEDLPADVRVIYVLEGATGGSGTRDSPYGTFDDFGTGGLSPGSIVAVGKGRYAGTFRITRPIEIRGACAAETVLSSDGPSEGSGVILPYADGLVLRDLAIADGARPAVWAIDADQAVHLEGVHIDAATGFGVVARNGARVTAHRLRISDTTPWSSDSQMGVAILAELGGSVVVERASIEGSRQAGVVVNSAGSLVHLSDAAVRGGLGRALDGDGGHGVLVTSGGRGELDRVALEGNRLAAVAGFGVDATLRLEDVVLRDTRSRAMDGFAGRGLDLAEGAIGEARRVALIRNRGMGVFVATAATRLIVEDVVVRDTLGWESDGSFGRGLGVQDGAGLVLTRASFERNRELGMAVGGVGTVAMVTDLTIRDVQPEEASGFWGLGIQVWDGAALELARADVADVAVTGFLATDAGTTVDVTDLAIHDVAQAADGTFGRGIAVQAEGIFVGRRVSIEDVYEVGLSAMGAPRVEIDGIRIARVARQACFELGTCGEAASMGLLTAFDAEMRLSHFEIANGGLCGVLLAEGAGVDLSIGAISGHTIGACVQVLGYDVGRLSTGVRYFDNGVNLDSTELPLPPALETLGP